MVCIVVEKKNSFKVKKLYRYANALVNRVFPILILIAMSLKPFFQLRLTVGR